MVEEAWLAVKMLISIGVSLLALAVTMCEAKPSSGLYDLVKDGWDEVGFDPPDEEAEYWWKLEEKVIGNGRVSAYPANS